MRWSVLIVLAACSRVTSSAIDDAAIVIDSRLFDAYTPDAAPPDAYVRRPCDAPATFADNRVPSRVLHVRPYAQNGDGSATAPFGTIAAAAAVATPGTFILLEPGVHASDQFIPNLRGTPTAPIWIGGALGTHPVINDGSEGLHLIGAAYVVIQHLDFRNQDGPALNIDGGVTYTGQAHDVVVSDVWIHDVAGYACIKASGMDNIFLYDNALQRCSIGIDLVGVHGASIARNVITSTIVNGMQARGGSTDIDIRQNRMRDVAGIGIELGGSTLFGWFRPALSTTSSNAEARRVRAFDNVITGNTGTPFAFLGCSDCLVAHNLTWGTPTMLIRIFAGPASQNGFAFEPTRNGRVINNAFVFSSSLLAHVDDAPAADVASFTFSHNSWLSINVPSQSTPRFSSTQQPVPDTNALIGAGTGYTQEIAYIPPYCGGPEATAGLPLPEIDGTIEGYCRADVSSTTIGPQIFQPDWCLLGP
ncbi:MAG TPA: right-handed parallel beta-helix repeat-containing protein [Kofleriaceae bacterium]